MLLCRLLILAPLLLCLAPGHALAYKGSTTELPEIGSGFFATIIQNLHHRYISNRKFNNETLQKFNEIWSSNFQKVADEIKGLGKELKTVSGAYDTVHNLQSSKEGLAAKAIKLASQTTALTTSGLGLITKINTVLADIATRFGGLGPLVTEFFFRNALIGKDAIQFATRTIFRRLRKVADEIKYLVKRAKEYLQALDDQLKIFLMRLTVSQGKVEIPIRQTIIAALSSAEVSVLRMKVSFNRIAIYVQQIVVAAENMTMKATAPMRTAIGKTMEDIDERVQNLIKGIVNILRRRPRTTPAPLTTIPVNPIENGLPIYTIGNESSTIIVPDEKLKRMNI